MKSQADVNRLVGMAASAYQRRAADLQLGLAGEIVSVRISGDTITVESYGENFHYTVVGQPGQEGLIATACPTENSKPKQS